MKNYLDEIYTVSEFQRDHPALAEKAERALNYLKGYCPGSEDATFVIIEVESYKCVAFLLNDFSPCTLADMIAPFDENKIYPLQELVTLYAFKRY